MTNEQYEPTIADMLYDNLTYLHATLGTMLDTTEEIISHLPSRQVLQEVCCSQSLNENTEFIRALCDSEVLSRDITRLHETLINLAPKLVSE